MNSDSSQKMYKQREYLVVEKNVLLMITLIQSGNTERPKSKRKSSSNFPSKKIRGNIPQVPTHRAERNPIPTSAQSFLGIAHSPPGWVVGGFHVGESQQQQFSQLGATTGRRRRCRSHSQPQAKGNPASSISTRRWMKPFAALLCGLSMLSQKKLCFRFSFY